METRFKPGKSGNPSGRPKKAPTAAEIAAKLLQEKVAVIENGEKGKIPSQEVILRATRAKAMKGDLKAGENLLRLAQHALPPSEAAVEGERPSLDDDAHYQAFLRDLALGEPASPRPAEVFEAGGRRALPALDLRPTVAAQESVDDPGGAPAPEAIASPPLPALQSNPPSPDPPLDSQTQRDLRITFGPFTSDK